MAYRTQLVLSSRAPSERSTACCAIPDADVRHAVIRDGVLSGEDDATNVPWWSFTKTVIAAAALALARDGRLALDRSLPGGYTLHQLLQHRAGLADYDPLAAYHAAVARHEDAWPAALILERADARPLIYPPRTGWTYSNILYLFVPRLIPDA